jgi:hypothetical protein
MGHHHRKLMTFLRPLLLPQQPAGDGHGMHPAHASQPVLVPGAAGKPPHYYTPHPRSRQARVELEGLLGGGPHEGKGTAPLVMRQQWG